MSQLYNLMVNTKWLMVPESLTALANIVVNREIQDKELFHHGDRNALIADMGESFSPFSTVKDGIGIINIEGPIVPRGSFAAISGPIASLETYTRDLLILSESDEIREIVLNIDSPGGSVTGVSEFADLIKSIDKPVTAYIYGWGMSAAYWIASAADQIVVSKTSEVGSIGVVASFIDDSEAMEKEGVKRFEIVSTYSPLKRQDPSSDEGKQAVINSIDAIAKVFIGTVAENRGFSFEKVHESFGQGLTFVAEEALKRGMVDKISTLQNLLTEKTEARMSENTLMDAEGFKLHNPEAYKAIYNEGVSAERDRLQSIEALSQDMPEASSVIDGLKYNAEMTKEKVALEIVKQGKELFKKAPSASSIQNDAFALGQQLEQIDDQLEIDPEKEASKKRTSDLIAGVKNYKR